ncbi:putative Ion channel Calcium activated BK potassium channel alpha subunit [Trypanosoma vivax]|nr:putative Ion transporter channel [Trypanosoma vivax]KAH8603985.1 putative Ion channel Calcium activated BK potassium channel alpha subunit [Trypanosoma vivax]
MSIRAVGSHRSEAALTMYVGSPSSDAQLIHESDHAFLSEVTDLTATGHYTQIAQYVPFRHSLRFRTLHRWGPARRSQITKTFHAEDETLGGGGSDNSSSTKPSLYRRFMYYFLMCGKNSERNDDWDWFGFVMTRGCKHLYLCVVRQRPVLAMCVWSILFLCEGAMVVLYWMQTTEVKKGATWSNYYTQEFSWYFYTTSILSMFLMSQLVFAYSFALITIAVVLATTIYQIVLFVIAFGTGNGSVTCVYVPLFLRCWPMRQYFLFLLDTLAMMLPRNDRLDIMRLAAPHLSMFLSMVFSAAGVLQAEQTLNGFDLTVVDSLYLVMATISTTGFGDVVPMGLDGRLLAIIIIFIFLAKMPSWVTVAKQTVALLRNFPRYTGTSHHFLVYGHVSHEEAVSILEEVFKLYPTKSVCFCNVNFLPDVLALGRHPRYRMRATFMVVKVLDRPTLNRMRVKEADAIIIFPTNVGVATTRDDDVFLSSMTFQRHAPHVQQYIRLFFGTHANLLRERKMKIIDQNMRTIMGTALLLPGIVPFLVNLVRRSSSKGHPSPSLWKEEEMDNWKEQYEYSKSVTFSTCQVPWFFAQLELRRVVRLMKNHNVLVVGVEEGSHKLTRLDLEYVVGLGDTLLLLHTGGTDCVDRALKALQPEVGAASVELQNSNEVVLVTQKRARSTAPFGGKAQNASAQDVFDVETEGLAGTGIDTTNLLYPYNASFDVVKSAGESSLAAADSDRCFVTNEMFEPTRIEMGSASSPLTCGDSDMQVCSLRNELLSTNFVDKKPGGVPLSHLPLGGSLVVLSYLLALHKEASGGMCCDKAPIERLEQQINDILRHVSSEYLHGASKKQEEENFLFIDQVSSFRQHPSESAYDRYLNNKASCFELLQMMQCLRAIYARSRITLLSSQTINHNFLQWWGSSFEFPLRYIRGMSSQEAHLNYAITESGGFSKLRGILLYCSQLGHWDFADIPLITVENNVRTLLEWASMQQQSANTKKSATGNPKGKNLSDARTHEKLSAAAIAAAASVEQHIMVELMSFKSCIAVAPHHTDAEWRERGNVHFEYSLAFMTGRCFSTNMLHTIFVYAHREPRIMSFFELVLCLNRRSNMFEDTAWASRERTAPTLFQACGNQLLHFQTFGDAFSFLLTQRSWVAIGIFRRFPESERLPCVSRYFITNPPLEMPLRADDVVYALSGVSGAQNRM